MIEDTCSFTMRVTIRDHCAPICGTGIVTVQARRAVRHLSPARYGPIFLAEAGEMYIVQPR